MCKSVQYFLSYSCFKSRPSFSITLYINPIPYTQLNSRPINWWNVMNVQQEWYFKWSIFRSCLNQICQPTVKCFCFPQVKSKYGALKHSMSTFFHILRSGPLRPRSLLRLEHCPIEMPNVAQHFVFQMKRI